MAQAKNKVEAVVETEEPVVKLSRVERLQQELREAEKKQQARGLKKLSALQEQRAGYQTRAAQLQEKIADLDAQIEQAKAELPIITDGVGVPPTPLPLDDENAVASVPGILGILDVLDENVENVENQEG